MLNELAIFPFRGGFQDRRACAISNQDRALRMLKISAYRALFSTDDQDPSMKTALDHRTRRLQGNQETQAGRMDRKRTHAFQAQRF